MLDLADTALRVPHSRIRELAEMAMAMPDVLRLYFGESDQPTPDFIKRAAVEALEDGHTFYSENAGLPSLRRALAGQYQRLHGVELDPATEVVVTASGVQALHLGIRCVLDPGDEALVLTPAWPNGAAMVRLASALPIELPQPLLEDRYAVDFVALEAALTPRTRLLLYTSPSNPLGWTATEEEQRRLLAFAREHGLWLVADEVYERLYYRAAEPGDTAPSILRLATRDDALVVVGSFSKTYCMTGWRVGWLIGPPSFGRRAGPLNEFVVSHAATFTQRAAEVAIAEGEDWVRDTDRGPPPEARPLPWRIAGDPGCHRARPGRRLLSLPANRRPYGLVRAVPAAPGREPGRTRPWCRVRRRWRRVRSAVLRLRYAHPRGGGRAFGRVPTRGDLSKHAL